MGLVESFSAGSTEPERIHELFAANGTVHLVVKLVIISPRLNLRSHGMTAVMGHRPPVKAGSQLVVSRPMIHRTGLFSYGPVIGSNIANQGRRQRHFSGIAGGVKH